MRYRPTLPIVRKRFRWTGEEKPSSWRNRCVGTVLRRVQTNTIPVCIALRPGTTYSGITMTSVLFPLMVPVNDLCTGVFSGRFSAWSLEWLQRVGRVKRNHCRNRQTFWTTYRSYSGVLKCDKRQCQRIAARVAHTVDAQDSLCTRKDELMSKHPRMPSTAFT